MTPLSTIARMMDLLPCFNFCIGVFLSSFCSAEALVPAALNIVSRFVNEGTFVSLAEMTMMRKSGVPGFDFLN